MKEKILIQQTMFKHAYVAITTRKYFSFYKLLMWAYKLSV